MAGENLGVQATEQIMTAEGLSQMAKKMGGIAGTLHINSDNDLNVIPQCAWDLSRRSGKPVIVVVNSHKQ